MKKVIAGLLIIMMLILPQYRVIADSQPSSWAVEEINKAKRNGLTIEKVLSNTTLNITREEFCELIIRLYEKLSGKEAAVPSNNAFTDTRNPEILKANALGIVNGIGEGRFDPSGLITREQIAVMFHRTLKVIDESLLTETFEMTFSDKIEIADWAVVAVAFMNGKGILGGTGNNRVAPKANASREQAVALVVRTYEKFSPEPLSYIIPNNPDWISRYINILKSDREAFIAALLTECGSTPAGDLEKLSQAEKEDKVVSVLKYYVAVGEDVAGLVSLWNGEGGTPPQGYSQPVDEVRINMDFQPYNYEIVIPSTVKKGNQNHIILSRGNEKDFLARELGCIALNIELVAFDNPKGVFLKETSFPIWFYIDGYVEDQFRKTHRLLEKMIDHAVQYLQGEGYNVDKRVLIAGFSGGGIFGQRFAVLSPEYVKAIVGGSCGGILLLPFEALNGKTLPFPLGISDYSSEGIDGRTYNWEAYQEIKQLIYVSNIDSTCPAIFDYIIYDDEKKDEKFSMMINTFGVYDTERLYNQCRYMRQNGVSNLYFTMYEEKERTPQMAHFGRDDFEIEFLRMVIENADEQEFTKFNTPPEQVEKLLQVEPYTVSGEGDRKDLFDNLKKYLTK